MDKTFFWGVVGLIFFGIGGALRMYMVVRVKGWSGYLARQTGVIDSYRTLAMDRRAPSWPLPVSYLCMVLGVAFVFGSILLFNMSKK
jgi:hypothetical protein